MFFYLAFLVFHVCKFDIMKKKPYFFEKKSGVSRFVTLPMKVIEKRKLHPWKFRKFVLHPFEVLHFFLVTPGCMHILFL